MPRLRIVAAALALLACLDEGEFGKFDRAMITAFAIEGQSRSAVIDSATASVAVTLPAGGELGAARIDQLELSSLARASVGVGDIIDLRAPYALPVTAEDGRVVLWTVNGRTEAPLEPPDGGEGGAGASDGCASYLVSYELSGIFETTDTPAGAGDAVSSIGPGRLTLRFVPTGPASADVELIAYEMEQKFTIPGPGATVTTDTIATAGGGACGVARGRFADGVVRWEDCDYGPSPPHGTATWSPADIAGGPGCVNDYNSAGVVSCEGTLCGLAGLDSPLAIDDTYPQPFNAFEFDAAAKSFHMRGLGNPQINATRNRVEVPSTQPGRTWLSFDGTEIERECAPVPQCP